MTPNLTERPEGRELIHDRDIRWRAYRCQDGLWDLEATLTDIRGYDTLRYEKGPLPAGEPLHLLGLRVTVDDSYTVQAVEASMDISPYQPCPQAPQTLSRLVGANLTRQWRERVQRDVGADQGCAHLRDLLMHAPTVAFQSIAVWHAQRAGDVLQPVGGKPPPHLGTCLSWSFDGPVVARIYPMFAGYRKPQGR